MSFNLGPNFFIKKSQSLPIPNSFLILLVKSPSITPFINGLNSLDLTSGDEPFIIPVIAFSISASNSLVTNSGAAFFIFDLGVTLSFLDSTTGVES